MYGQCITYDFAINGYGQIGGASEKSLKEEPNWGGGIEYGYSFPVTDHLNIDLSIGAGYFGGKYTDYIPMEDCLVIQSTKRRQWIGPSKAEVSLVWLLFNTESYKGKVDKK